MERVNSHKRRGRNLGRRRVDGQGRSAAVRAYLILLTFAVMAVGVMQIQSNRLAHRTDRLARRTSRLAHRTGMIESQLLASNLRLCHRLNLVRAGDNVSHLFEWTLSTQYHIPAKLRNQLTWIPLTDSCSYAVTHAGTFRAPTPVHFFHQLPGPDNLKVGPGE